MRKMSLLLIVVLLVCAVPAMGLAASPWTEETTSNGKMVKKLEFGFRNVLGGWTEVFREPVEHHRVDPKLGLIKGLGIGLFNGALDTVGGALHILTFPITSLDVPLPENGIDI